MKCLNTYGCNNEAVSLKINGKICKNFCSYECCLIYKGKKKPPIPERKIFDDPERQHLHDLYIWALTGIDPRKPYIRPKKRGVKKGTIRGSYKIKKKRISYVKNCLCCNREFTTKNKNRKYCNQACKQRTHRKRKIIFEIEREKVELANL